MNSALVLVLTGLLTALSVMLLCRLYKEHVLGRKHAEKFALLASRNAEFDLSWASKEAQKQAAIETAKRQQASTNVQPMPEWQTSEDALAPSSPTPGNEGWATEVGLKQLDTAIMDHDSIAGDQTDVAPMPEAFLDP